MNVTLRYCLALGAFLSGLFGLFDIGVFEDRPAYGQVTADGKVTTYKAFWEALDSGDTTINFDISTSTTGPMKDDDGESMDFILDNPVEGTITITGTPTIQYNANVYDPDSENDFYMFRIDIVGGTLTVSSATTKVTKGYSDAGIFYVEDGTLSLKSATLQNNYSEDSGGAIFAITGGDTTSVSISEGLTLEYNTAENDGGGFALYNTGTILKVGGAAKMNSNKAGSGGAVYAQGAVMTFDNTLTASQNRVSGDGGVFNLDSGAELTVAGTATFTQNAAEYDFTSGDENSATGGGAIYSNMSTATFKSDAVFGFKDTADTTSGNTAKTAGGAIYAEGDSTFTFQQSAVFGGNTASAGSGGAIYLDSSLMTFSGGATFTGNEAKSGEGGALLVSGGTLNFTGAVDFKDNIATGGTYGGGAIYADLESVVTFAAGSTVTFSGNKAVALAGEESLPGGGAVFLSGLGAPTNDPVEYGWTMNGNSTFSVNEAAGSGGAIYVESSALQFSTTTFSGNKAGFVNDDDQWGGGGALFVDTDSVVHFEQKATFQNNTATTGSGGAVFMTLSGSADAENPVPGMHFKNGAELSGNKAVHGGAFFLQDSVVTFGGATTISGNEATGSGGAFYVQGDTLLHFEAGGTTTISGNKATGDGRAVFVDEDSNLTLKLGGSTGTAVAAVTVAAGTSSAANDIYLSSGASLNAVVDTGSTLTINSAFSGASRDVGDTFLNVTGPGTVRLGGDTTGFQGDISISGDGTLIVNPGSNVLGNIDNTSLTISDGILQVLLDQDGDRSNPARVQVAELDIDSDEGYFYFDVTGFVTNENEVGDGFALLSINDSDGEDILLQLLSAERISWMGSTDFHRDILSDGDIFTLYVYVVFDPDVQPWTFNVADGTTKTLDLKLDNTDTTHSGNQFKGLTLGGTGTLELLADENHVSYLTGTGHVKFDGTLNINGQIDPENPDPEPEPFTGSLFGGGTFVKEGKDFTQYLHGSNTQFTGDFNVKDGTLSGNTESLRNTITVAGGAVLEFDQATIDDIATSSRRTFEGTLTGSGTVRFLGVNSIEDPLTGDTTDTILVIDNDNSGFKGEAFVDRGWLLMESTGNLTGVTEIGIGADGGLGGSGRVGNVAVGSGGVLQAYQGDLTIDGNLSIDSGGIIYVVLESDASSVIVTGNAKLQDGARVEIAGIADDYVQGETFVFLTADDIVLFGEIESSEYEAGDGTIWVLEFGLDEDGNLLGSGTIKDGPDPPKPIVVGLARNQAVVAQALAAIRPLDTTPTEMKNFIDKLDTHKTTDSDGNVKYDEIYLAATKQLAGTIRVDGLQLGLYSPSRTVLNRLNLGSNLYGGAPVIYNNGYGPISGMENRGAGAGPTTYRGQEDMLNPHYDACAPTCDIPCMMGENNFWVDVTHVQTKTKGDANSYEYGSSRTGLLIGMDIQKKMTSRIGAVFGYFAPYLWQNSDRVEADDYHAGLYFQKNHMGTDLYGYFGYAHQDYRSRRFVNMGIVDPVNFGLDRYNGKTDGDSFNFSLEMSKPRYYGHCYVLRPLLGVDYVYTKQKGFAESGAGLFGLRYNQAEYDQWFVRVGMNLKKETERSSTVLRIQYINQFGENGYPDANARFVYTGAPTMNVRGVNLGRDYLNLGFGYNLFVNEARSKYVSFDYDFNTSRKTKSHGVSLILVERF